MIWPIALSFTNRDLELARSVAVEFRQNGIAAYFYEDEIADQVGDWLFGLHQRIYASAHAVAFVLRADFLDRPYTRLEYEVRSAHARWPDSALFISMEETADWIIPPTARFRLRAYKSQPELQVDAISEFLAKNFRLLR